MIPVPHPTQPSLALRSSSAVWREFLPIARGVLIAAVVCFVITLIAGLVYSRERARTVATQALGSAALILEEHPDEDIFGECDVMMMNIYRRGALANTIDLIRAVPKTEQHPCVALATALRTGPDGLIIHNYPNYYFLSRQLEGIPLSVMDFRHARVLYSALSYGSVLALLIGAWFNSRKTALLVLPIVAYLFFGFSQHLHANSLLNAPGFFIGFYSLALFLGLPNVFRHWRNRLVFFGFLAAVTTFYQLIVPLPVLLSLTIVLNQLVYVTASPGSASDGLPDNFAYLRHSVFEVAMVFGCFFGIFVFLSVAHLLMLATFEDSVFTTFADKALVRVGTDTGSNDTITLADVLTVFWVKRYLMAGTQVSGAWLLLGGFGAWLCAAFMAPLAMSKRVGRSLHPWVVDVGVLFAASVGGIVFLLILRNHTWVHPFLTVRELALPAAYGFVAVLLLGRLLWLQAKSPAQRIFPALLVAVCAILTVAMVGSVS